MPKKPLIAVTIIRPNAEGVKCGIEEAVLQGADLIEIRADAIENLKPEDLAEISGYSSLPKIFTLRHKEEAGPNSKFGFKGTEGERLNFYLKAAKLGIPYVDIEDEHPFGCDWGWLENQIRTVSDGKTKIISSWHNWEATPISYELGNKFHRMSNNKPYIVKMSTVAKTYEDNLKMLQLSHWARTNHSGQRKLLMTMGPLCEESRVYADRHDMEWTYACLKGEAAAPGQMSIGQLRRKRAEPIDE